MHYLSCPDIAFTAIRQTYLQLLTKQLHAIQTYPGITTTIVKILRHGYQKSWIDELNDDAYTHPILLDAIKQQQSLGEHSLPLGYLSSLWENTQLQWSRSTNTKMTGGSWMTTVITILHTYTYSIWKERNKIVHQHSKKSKRTIA